MKKKMVMAGSAVAAAAILGLGLYHSDASQADTLSTTDIKQMVQDQYPGTITEIELDKSTNKSVYEVEIEGENKSYDLTLNAETGEVLSLEEKTVFTNKKADKEEDNKLVVKEKEDADQAAENKQDTKKNVKKQEAQSSSKEQSAKKEQPKQSNQDKGMIGGKEASRIALNEIDFPGTVVSVELDEDDGRMIYEVEIEGENGEADVEIDAYTGKIIVLEVDLDDYDDDNDDSNDNNDSD
ncbi:hypothetical protein JNUCC1_02321 [Lentibacillus sp. JNUCC-1]|uniref:PepSY domain-containing protein n=1 Tax=Lentibacillus sp. JNUCC-1 TaxID=2654513 RepID=UPI0012E91E42|nr:PepSY domain-containing protein [Lentibacillus sp. JNUCC-1]MUV38483.1 hypothetical protein [Lentibacillus sp. JNUCC-1]